MFASFNYRLGPLAFPVGVEATAGNALNVGIKDQFAALEWIQRNIGAFGGDKTKACPSCRPSCPTDVVKVTVFGVSAGAISIGVLFFSSQLEKLARAAVSHILLSFSKIEIQRTRVQVFESGSAGSVMIFPPTVKQQFWNNLQ
jgi:carboxylesterase type B